MFLVLTVVFAAEDRINLVNVTPVDDHYSYTFESRKLTRISDDRRRIQTAGNLKK